MLTTTITTSRVLRLASGATGNDKLKLEATKTATTTKTETSTDFGWLNFCLFLLTLAQVGAAGDAAAAAKVPSLGPDGGGCFRSAVFQNTFRRFDDCHASVERNLDIYDRVAREAAQNGAKIIVFPEDGVFIGSRRFVAPCLVELPASHSEGNGGADGGEPAEPVIPCEAPSESGSSIILERLSCMARQNSLFVVANFATRGDCSLIPSGSGRQCPREGYFMFNTNVVFDSHGRLIKVYRKFNPFTEALDGATQLELAYFDTDFGGRFGLFTCFDIIFKSPAIDLIEKHNIGTALFPTWWFDKLPIHSAIQYQDAWSMGNRVNLLASNLLEPGRGSIGFGIYSGQSNDSIYSGADQLKARLLLANLRAPGTPADQCQFDPVALDIETDSDSEINSYKPFKHFELSENELIVQLTKATDDISVCLGAICCHLEYELARAIHEQPEFQDRLVLVVKDGPTMRTFNWWEQTCFLATLEKPLDPRDHFKNVKFSLEDGPEFERLTLRGNFSSKYVMPTASRNVSRLIDRDQRVFDCRGASSPASHEDPELATCEQQLAVEPGADPIKVNSFGLYGRVFNKDQMKTRAATG